MFFINRFFRFFVFMEEKVVFFWFFLSSKEYLFWEKGKGCFSA